MCVGKLRFAGQKHQLCRVWLCFRCMPFSGRPSTSCLAWCSEWMGISRQKTNGIKTNNFLLLPVLNKHKELCALTVWQDLKRFASISAEGCSCSLWAGNIQGQGGTSRVEISGARLHLSRQEVAIFQRNKSLDKSSVCLQKKTVSGALY